jgi:hypothetical protein
VAIAAFGASWVMSMPNAVAQPAAASTAALQRESLDPVAGRAIVRAVLVDLRAHPEPGPADYAIAAALLSRAASMAGDPTDILRLALAAAQESGEADRVLDISRRLVKADPEDTAAQLQLIEARASQAADADGRLAVYDAVLGPRGAGVDDSVRSRVALAAAMIRRQRGDVRGYADNLTRASALDSSNKQAAAGVLEFFVERVNDPVGRVELLTNLLLADPLDAQSHALLAGEFSAAGVPEASLRFYDNAERIMMRLGHSLSPQQSADRWVQQAKLQGVAVVARQLTAEVDEPRRAAQIARDQARLARRDMSDLPDPGVIRLTPELERLRLACALAAGDAASTAASLKDFAAYAMEFAIAANGAKLPPAPAEFELAFMRLWANIDVDKARADLERFRAAGSPPEVLARLSALSQHRAGNRDEARAGLRAMPTDALALVALAQVEIDAGSPREVIEPLLLNITTTAPGTALSVWAGAKFVRIAGQPVPQSPVAEQFAQLASGIGTWVDDLSKDPARFVTMLVTTPRPIIDAVEPMLITARLRHSLPVPLAIGPGEVLDSRFLVTNMPDFGRGVDARRATSEVLNLDRRLRLMPREELVVTAWAEPGAAGWATESGLTTAVRTRLRVVNGFQVFNGVPQVVGLGGAMEVGPVTRAAPEMRSAEQLISAIGVEEGRILARTLVQVRRVLLDAAGGGGGVSAGDAGRIVTALVERYRQADASLRVLLLTGVPNRTQSGAAAAFDQGVAEIAETDSTVRLVKLFTRAAETKILDAGKADADLARAATRLAARIEANVPTFATLRDTLVPGESGAGVPVMAP